jgi:oligopeptide/dipeptide ABC transporter ATP-binding protein
MATSDREAILEISDLSIAYPIAIGTVRAVEDVTLAVRKGEVLGVVGESGCGKSTLGLAVLNLLKPPGRITGGRILFDGRDILAMAPAELLKLRGEKIAMIFQNPLTSLDPLMSVQDHFIETIRAHEPGTSIQACLERAGRILVDLGIEPKRLAEYPFQLSGGMRQRIMIGLALVLRPTLLLADEPTTALDVIVEAGFTQMLLHLRERYDLTVLLISHNLAMVAEIADRIAVMYGGRIVELADAQEIFAHPRHPYTQGLIACVPNILLDQKELNAMPGSPPDLVGERDYCSFHPRCPHAMDVCRGRLPRLADQGDAQVACWLYQGEA